MNPEKVVFGFFIVLALTLNFGFFIGDIDNPAHHHVSEFVAALVVNLIATILKFGDRSQVGSVLLATSLVADLQLFSAALVWGFALYVEPVTGLTPGVTTIIVSLSGGALVANIVSVLLLIIEMIMFHR